MISIHLGLNKNREFQEGINQDNHCRLGWTGGGEEESGWARVPLRRKALKRVTLRLRCLVAVVLGRKYKSSSMRTLVVKGTLAHSLLFFVLFVDFSARPCLFSSFVACDTNDVD